MQLHNIKSNTRLKNKKRIGRGGRRGTYSGKGQKGQKSRAGHRIRPMLRDIIKRIPKKRGYRFKSIKEKPAVVNLEIIEKKFKNGEKITPASLFDAGVIKKMNGKLPSVKILGGGDITKSIFVAGCAVSGPAKEKIEKAGGKITHN